MLSDRTDIADLLARTDLAAVAARYTSLKHHGSEWLGICPFHAERTPSFTIFAGRSGKHRFHCHGCGAGGDAIDFVMRAHQCDTKDAIAILSNDSANVEVLAPKKSGPKKPQRLTRPAEPADRVPDFSVSHWGAPTAVWPYRSPRGRTLFYVARYEFEQDGKRKKVTPQWTVGSLDGGRTFSWGMGHYAVPRPLYAMDELAVRPDAPVIVCEGEKTADAAQRLLPDYVAVTWPGGSNAVKKSDFSPLQGRDVILWPDADAHVYPDSHEKAGELMPLAEQVGTRCMVEVAGLLNGVSRSTRLVQVPVEIDHDGWDAADIEAAGWATDYTATWLEERAASWSSFVELSNGTFEANEDQIALAFADKFANILRYCHDWGYWLEWDGNRWRQERTRLAFHYAREISRAANIKNEKSATKAATAAGAERFAQTDRRLATTSTSWDQNDWLLATPDGTVDLRTGEISKSRPDDRITKLTACGVGDECPVWMEFLDQATKDDAELIDYLQRVAGYCLTGSIKEHALFFVHGDGGNGKGIFINAIQGVMGEYARVAKMDTFTASRNDRHASEIAFLNGARLVTAQETQEGRHWDDVKVKAMTGGDPITANFMRQNPFTFQATFKLLIAGNHKPALKTVDEAIRRRFQIIPFINKPEIPDKDLAEKIKAEWKGVLNWMIEGCLNWQKIGLHPPAVVLSATQEYFDDQNTFLQWIEECCVLGINEADTSGSLYSSWKNWCDSNGERCGTKITLADHLKREHFKNGKVRQQRGFLGISVKVAEPLKSFQERDWRDD